MSLATSPLAFRAAGTIAFSLLDPSDVPVDTESVAVSGNGTYTTPLGYVPTQLGTYRWADT